MDSGLWVMAGLLVLMVGEAKPAPEAQIVEQPSPETYGNRVCMCTHQAHVHMSGRICGHIWGFLSEKAMAPHSSTLAWKIPWTEEPCRLQSMGSLESDTTEQLHIHFTFMHWRRKWQPTPVFLPGEPQGRGSRVGCCLWDHTESDMTEAT